MSEDSGNTPRPTPRARPTATGRPSPRPRVAGARRERDEPGPQWPAPDDALPSGTAAAVPDAEAGSPDGGTGAGTPDVGTGAGTPDGGAATATGTRATARPRGARRGGAAAEQAASTTDRRRVPALALVLALLCVAAAVAGGLLLWQRLNPPYVDAGLLAAARSNVEALYAYDYKDSEGSLERKLDALTGDLREQTEADLSQGGIVDVYEQVSATTRYEVLDIGVKQVNRSQDTATLVVFGQYVLQSANSGEQAAPQGSECSVTPEGAQSCVQTLRIRVVEVDGEWKISEATVLTTS